MKQAAVVHDAFELSATLHEPGDGFLVLHFLGDNESPCKCIETAGCPAVLLRGFRKEQVTGMLQIRPLVEMAFETAAQKAQVFLANIRFISLNQRFLDKATPLPVTCAGKTLVVTRSEVSFIIYKDYPVVQRATG